MLHIPQARSYSSYTILDREISFFVVSVTSLIPLLIGILIMELFFVRVKSM